MTLVQSLSRDPQNPTEFWPDPVEAPPAFDWSELRFGPIRFGEPLEYAAPLGRPNVFRWTETGGCDLLYTQAGFSIGFDQARFAYIACFIAPDPNTAMHAEMAYCTPSLDDELVLSPDARPNDVTSRLGPPGTDKIDRNGDRVLVYAGEGVVLEFEFDRNGGLTRWNLYPQAVKSGEK
ncbi:MAG: hypothetical protein ACRELX_00795 [Longimicrobiales bacterium]